MLKPARKKNASLNWKKYERNLSLRLNTRKLKKTKPQIHHSKSIAFGIAGLLFLVVLILIGKLFGFLGSINEPYLKDTLKSSSWNGESPLNLVVKADMVYLLSYQPKSKSLTVLKFPGDIYIDTSYHFGRWPIRSIYDLGQAENPPMGARLLVDSVGNAFNLVLDGYIILDISLNLTELIEKERGSLIPGVDLLSKSKTNLNFLEYLKVWYIIKNVRSDKIKIIDLEKSDLTQWLLLPDGSRVVSLDLVKLGQFEEGRFVDTNIQDEGLSIGIFNATDYPGLAEKAAKIITNLGGRVIFTSNAPEKEEKSMILGDKGYSTDYLINSLRLFCPQPKSGRCSLDDSSLDISRADILIILGEDSFLKYTQK